MQLTDKTNGQWKMILDDVDDVETFFPKNSKNSLPSLAAYNPQSRNRSVLISSQNEDAAAGLIGGYSSITEVRPMDERQDLQLLWNKLQYKWTGEGALIFSELSTAYLS